MRRVQGIDPHVLSAVLMNNGELEVITGHNGDRIVWKLRCDDAGWTILEQVNHFVFMDCFYPMTYSSS